MSIFEEFDKRRSSGNDKIFEQEFLPYKRFMNLDTTAYSDGSINKKHKELIGLACSLVLRCNDCVLYHIKSSYEEGATRQELNEAMNIAMVVGGSIVIPHLRFALEAIDELNIEKSER